MSSGNELAVERARKQELRRKLCRHQALGNKHATLECGSAHDLSRRAEGCTMKVPVAVLRLPRGPDGSRGFDPNSLRFQSLGPASLSSVGSGNTADVEQEQQSRVVLRERYLRSLRAMVGRPVHFTMYERVHVTALFGASDIDILNFQVLELQTPLGMQKAALLRCSDIIAYSFEL